MLITTKGTGLTAQAAIIGNAQALAEWLDSDEFKRNIANLLQIISQEPQKNRVSVENHAQY